MMLTTTQETLLNKLRATSGGLGVPLDDGICSFLLAVAVRDLDLLDRFPEFQESFPPFFGAHSLRTLRIDGVDFRTLFARLIALEANADAYFFCLATLHKARLKYERILQAQEFPTIDQIGPRGLLQYGSMAPRALAGFMFWRKWLFDVDNRAGQETGYLFEPILAYAIGGSPCSARNSEVKRGGTGAGRQVDCIRGRKAYEFKLRVTIAASGQGRWREELSFPEDCRASNYTPVLVVLDPTPSDKLNELAAAFKAAGGEAYIEDAWSHLRELAGPVMARFLQLYVHGPIEALLQVAPNNTSGAKMPDLMLGLKDDVLRVVVGEEVLEIWRDQTNTIPPSPERAPEDIEDTLPGV
jgi:hypothetical protein